MANSFSIPTTRYSIGLMPILNLALFLFVISCIFDPANYLGTKFPLFIFCWLVLIQTLLVSRTNTVISTGIVIYTILFICIPLYSIALFYITGGQKPFEGFNLLRGYILISLAPLLAISKISLMPILAKVLSVLAMCIIVSSVILQFYPDFFSTLHAFGKETGIVLPDRRDYGGNVVLLQVYFVTSPMLAISAAYYFGIAKASKIGRERTIAWMLFTISLFGLVLAGSRNNILVAIILPVALFFIVSKHKILNMTITLIIALWVVLIFKHQLAALFDPNELSNAIKFQLVKDYGRILFDPITFVLGQGLGAYEYWEAKERYDYITELTYLEMFRNFGLFGGLLMGCLLLFPIWHAFCSPNPKLSKTIAIGFLSYLGMCATNPNLFNSMGILILSVLLARIYTQPISSAPPTMEQSHA